VHFSIYRIYTNFKYLLISLRIYLFPIYNFCTIYIKLTHRPLGMSRLFISLFVAHPKLLTRIPLNLILKSYAKNCGANFILKNLKFSQWSSICYLPVFCLAHSSSLKIGATCCSETAVAFQQITQRYIPEDISFNLILVYMYKTASVV
jgi:hypothetical protein